MGACHPYIWWRGASRDLLVVDKILTDSASCHNADELIIIYFVPFWAKFWFLAVAGRFVGYSKNSPAFQLQLPNQSLTSTRADLYVK